MAGFLNVAAHLPALAERMPHALAVVCPAGRDRWNRVTYSHYTFQQLDRVSSHFARTLESIGIRRGTRSVLMVPPSLEFFALTFALFKLAAVPVIVDPGMGIRNLGKCLAEAQPEAFVGIPKAHLARRILGWGRATVRTTVTVGRPGLGSTLRLDSVPADVLSGSSASLPAADVKSDEMAAILFTSGSTGVAKGAVYTHGIFASQVEAIRTAFDIKPGEIDLTTFPLFALFGPALGMTGVVPDMDPTRPANVDPNKIFETVNDFGVTNMFGSPALLNRVARSEKPGSFPSVRRVISAGAPVPATVIERFVKLLPKGTQVFTPYGATEALPVAVIGSDEILAETRHKTSNGAGVCVGRPVSGIKVRIIRISDEPIASWHDELELPVGQIGEIAVQGPWVTEAYYNRPDATRLAKIGDSNGELYHRMGDLGYFDENGRLWFCGRKSHRVVTESETLFTIPCEAIFNSHSAVFRTALVGVSKNGETVPVLCVEREQGDQTSVEVLRKQLLEIGSKFPHTKGIQTILFRSAFPVDTRHNSKIFREKLAVWAAKRLR
jgi:olefin beta-lactone synthetase